MTTGWAPAISFMTANFVAREHDWSIPDWETGDRSVRAAFEPIETFPDRFGALLDEAVVLGFEAVDIWDAHLSAQWATPDHVDAAVEALRARNLTVASLAGWLGSDPSVVESACRIAVAVGAPVLGGSTKLLERDRARLVGMLDAHDLRFGLENHPERTPAEMLAKIGDDAEGRIGTTVDTGWYGTQGYDAARAIEELGDRVVHVHLKDVRHAGRPHETCGYGDGVVPLERCVEALRLSGYRGSISVEHEPEGYDPRPEIAAARERLAGWLTA